MSIFEDVKETERKIRKESANTDNVLPPELSNIKENVTEIARNVKAISNDKAHEATKYLNDRMHDLKSAGSEALEKTERKIQRNPGQSVAIAFAVGILASFLFGRRT